MEKMKKCKACGADIAKSAKICPHCGAKNGGSKIPLIIVIVIVLLIVIAALAASLFHFNELKISDLKEYLDQRGISVRR